MERKRTVWLLVGVLAAILVLGVGGLYLQLPQFKVQNNSSVKKFGVSRIWGSLYLWQSGYWSQVDGVRVIYTDEPQPAYRHDTVDGEEVMSANVERQNKQVTIYLRYNGEKLGNIERLPYWYERDVYAAICMAVEGKKLKWDECISKAMNYVHWRQENKLPGALRGYSLLDTSLVKQAHAACFGTIPCGQTRSGLHCVGGDNHNTSCDYSYECKGGGSCEGGLYCDTTANQLDCSAISDQNSCDENSSVDRCATGCNNVVSDNFCTWGSGASQGGGGGCTIGGITDAGVNCLASGLNGEYFTNNMSTLIAEGYSCGPRASLPGNPLNSCGNPVGWWEGRWEGYLNVTQAGWYQFLARVYPQAGMAIDLNGDEILPSRWGRAYGGEGYMYLSTNTCPTSARYLSLQRFWSANPSATLGNCRVDCEDGSEGPCWCEEGRHCQFVDYNGRWEHESPGSKVSLSVPAELATPAYPQTPPYRTPNRGNTAYPTYSDPGTSDTPGNEVLFTSNANYLIEPDPVDDDGENGGYSVIYAKRWLPVGSHKIRMWYRYNVGSSSNTTTTHYYDLWYKAPDSENRWIKTSDLDDAACPFSPCKTNPVPPPPELTCKLGEIGLTRENVSAKNDFTVKVSATEGAANITAMNINGDNITCGAVTTDGAGNYTTTCTANGPGETTFSASADIGSDVGVCTANASVTLQRLRARVYQVTSGDCDNPEPGFGGDLDLSGGDLVVVNPTVDPFENLVIPGFSQELETLIREDVTTYNYVYTPSAEWIRVYCPTGSNDDDGNYYPPDGEVYDPDPDDDEDPYIPFYVTQAHVAWFQINQGDVAARGGSIGARVPASETFLGPATDGINSSGVAMAQDVVTILGAGALGPDGRLYAARGASWPNMPTSWFQTLWTTFDQPVVAESGSVSISADPDPSDPDGWTAHTEEPGSFVRYIDGDVTIDGDLEVSSGKWTVFVDGNLSVEAESVTVLPGAFLGFVVTGSITMNENTRQIQGTYIGDGPMSINEADVAEVGLARQFDGQGIFVGMGGVNLSRDLNNPNTNTDDLANNSDPAIKITYRPDMIINAPIGFTRGSIEWQEVAPGTGF